MKNQVHIYTLTDRDFYSPLEQRINKNIIEAKVQKKLMEEYYIYTIIIAKDKKIAEDKKAKSKKFQYKFASLADFEWQKYNDIEIEDGKKQKCCYVQRFIKSLIKNHQDEYKQAVEALKQDTLYKFFGEYIAELNRELNKAIAQICNESRRLNPDSLKKRNVIGVFESDLTRTTNLKTNEISKDIVIVKIHRYAIMDQLIQNGFTLRGKKIYSICHVKLSRIMRQNYQFKYIEEKYVPLTSSAGQIRTKKILFIKESIKTEFENTLMCGLTIDKINEQGGCNINKFLSYLALVNSATDPIQDFDIDKAIVIEDWKTMVNGKVDFIEKELIQIEDSNGKVIREYWQLKDKPVRQDMSIEIVHSDGCGWISPKAPKLKKNFMIRLPWIKGLMTVVDYLKWSRMYNNNNNKVTDIYGKEWDLKKDDILYVFSRSQFKMWDFYPNELNEDGTIKTYGWDIYKDNFKKHGCHANYCNEEPDAFEDKRFNYQMLQTLTDIADEELKAIAEPTTESIKKAYTNRGTMLKLLGATKDKQNKTYLQQALAIYPELINDNHVKKELSNIINARRKEAMAGKIQLDCKYTFLLPDVFAWLQYSLGKNKEPEGLLQDGEVYCKLYKDKPKLLVERSPHLYKEHAVRSNAIKDDLEGIKKSDWFTTDGVYTSSHDLISKLLQFDNDGDRALVISDKELIKIAERNMKDVVPLYYKMGKAKTETITNESITKSLRQAFKYSNIGMYSNKITKLWNADGEKDLDLIKILCCINNFSIDAAKTLEMVRVSDEVQQKINAIDKLDLPYFFKYAKNKEKVADLNESTVNKLCKLIEDVKIPVKPGTKNEKYDFSTAGRFRSSMLMHNPKIEINEEVTQKYEELDKAKNQYFMWSQSWGLEKQEVSGAVYQTISNEFFKHCKKMEVNRVDAVDMVIKHIYKNHRQTKKTFLFNCFGMIIINNLQINIKRPLGKDWLHCAGCGKRAEKTGNNQTMCLQCSQAKIKEKDRERKSKD